MNLLLLSGVKKKTIFQCKGLYSRETTHSVGVPHKQILAFIRLQHKLGDADACRGVTVEHDGG